MDFDEIKPDRKQCIQNQKKSRVTIAELAARRFLSRDTKEFESPRLKCLFLLSLLAVIVCCCVILFKVDSTVHKFEYLNLLLLLQSGLAWWIAAIEDEDAIKQDPQAEQALRDKFNAFAARLVILNVIFALFIKIFS